MRGTRFCTVVTLLAVSAVLMTAATASAAPAVVPRPLCCIPTGDVTAITVSGNTAYLGGTFHHMGQPAHHLAVLDATSAQAQTGWPGVDGGYVLAAIGDGQGGWFVGGSFTSIGGVDRQHLAHLLPDKSVDASWTASTNGTVRTLLHVGGAVYAGGAFSQANGGTARANLAAFDETSGALTTFQADTDGQVNALAASSRCATFDCLSNVRRLYIGGSFTQVRSTPRHGLAAIDLNTDGLVGSDPKLNGGVNALVVRRGLAFFNPVTVYAAGNFTVVDVGVSNLGRGYGARFDEDPTATPLSWNPAADDSITSMALGSGGMYLAGGFDALGSSFRTHFGLVDANSGAVNTTWGPTVSYSFAGQMTVRSLVLLGATVYVGGRFDHANTTTERRNLAAFDASTGAVTSWDPDAPGVNFAIQSLGSDGTSLIASGEFETIAGVERHNLAAIDLAGGQVTPFNPDLDAGVNTLALQGTTLYAGGQFTHVSGGSLVRHSAAAFDTTTGQPTSFDPDPSGEILAIAPAGGTVFLGGVFLNVNGGGANRKNLAEVDAQTGAATSFQQDNGGVTALALRGNTLFAGGPFSQMGAATRHGLASVQIIPGTLGAVTTFDAGLDNGGGSADVRALLLHGSTLYVGGNFTTMLGASRSANGAIDVDTRQVTAFDPHADFYADAFAADDVNLFAAGQFLQFGSAPRADIASVDLQTGTANDWYPALPLDAHMHSLGISPDGGLVAGGDAIGPTNRAQGLLLAFALQPSTPAAPQATAGVGDAAVSFGAPADGGSPITGYKVTASPGGQTATGAGSPITVTGLTPGTVYTFTVSAVNAAGESPQSPASNSVTPAAPVAGGPAPPGAGGAAVLTASGFKVTNKRFKVAKGKTALSARTPKGTTFVFRLSADATSRIAIERALPGRKKGKRCVAPRRTLKKRCTRYQKVGTLTRKKTKAGTNRVPFTGRMGKRALKPGSYRATLTATDASGKRSKPVRLTFRVVLR